MEAPFGRTAKEGHELDDMVKRGQRNCATTKHYYQDDIVDESQILLQEQEDLIEEQENNLSSYNDDDDFVYCEPQDKSYRGEDKTAQLMLPDSLATTEVASHKFVWDCFEKIEQNEQSFDSNQQNLVKCKLCTNAEFSYQITDINEMIEHMKDVHQQHFVITKKGRQRRYEGGVKGNAPIWEWFDKVILPNGEKPTHAECIKCHVKVSIFNSGKVCHSVITIINCTRRW